MLAENRGDWRTSGQKIGVIDEKWAETGVIYGGGDLKPVLGAPGLRPVVAFSSARQVLLYLVEASARIAPAVASPLSPLAALCELALTLLAPLPVRHL